MSEISAIKNTPDISFIDGKTVDDVQREMIADFEDYMTRIDGRPVTLGRASVHRAIINAAAVQIYLAMQYVDRAGKQNLLKYAYGDFLDNLALLRGVERTPATAATTTLKFTASAARASAISIPQGTRVASAGGTFIKLAAARCTSKPSNMRRSRPDPRPLPLRRCAPKPERPPMR